MNTTKNNSQHSFSIRSLLADVHTREVYPAEVVIVDGIITSIQRLEDTNELDSGILIPGFVDAHVHIESSMLPPAEFGRWAIKHGTLATVSDPHEIANVLGIKGVEFMLQNAKETPLCIAFGAPSCVPATHFETAGAVIDANDIKTLIQNPEIYYLAEMMNYPGVLNKDPEIIKKLNAAKEAGKPIDGHAPGLRGKQAQEYILAGISTDHECFTVDEAKEKRKMGMKILIREGSAARNLEALWPLFLESGNNLMLCSDDLHPDLLMLGHINRLVRILVKEKGMNIFDVLQAACINPVEHYNLPIGTLKVGDSADFILVNNLFDFEPLNVWIKGIEYLNNEKNKTAFFHCKTPNQCISRTTSENDFTLKLPLGPKKAKVIEAIDGELITPFSHVFLPESWTTLNALPSDDILLIAVVNRYKNAVPSLGLIKNFGFTKGAIGSSVAHDSHNFVLVGSSPEYLSIACNTLFEMKGGLVWIDENKHVNSLSLPLAGLMSDQPGDRVAHQYTKMSSKVKDAGCTFKAPFMTLSFMALPVIPHLKMTDLSLFSVDEFKPVSVLS